VSTVEIEGRSVRLTNLDKVLWPDAGLTKGEMIEYYLRVAPVLLPHLQGRPLTLRRFPAGIGKPSWHQNECRGEPEWLPVFETPGRGGRVLRFCMVEDLADLAWLANQAAVELHPFTWRTEAPRLPTALLFDLDPGPPAGLIECARVALRLRDLLEGLRMTCLLKTSGSLGLHVHVPLGGPHDGERLKAFARATARVLAERYSNEIIAEMDKSQRAGKVFLDWLQNDPTRQTVAPYSLRGLPWPTVATPVRWEEAERAVAEEKPELLTFLGADVLERVERHGDLFEAELTLEQTLPRFE
jgi:bifunctional non-homologous end joining protein LigD